MKANMPFTGKSWYNVGNAKANRAGAENTRAALITDATGGLSMTTCDSTPNPNAISIPLTKGYSALIDEIDADIADSKWNVAELPGQLEYAARGKSINGHRTTVYMHRAIMARVLGRELTRAEKVDHINHDGLDNRRSNLRLATHAQNIANGRHRKNNTSGFKGVSWDKQINKWIAQIHRGGRKIYIGAYTDPKVAHEHYLEKAAEIQGEFATDGKDVRE